MLQGGQQVGVSFGVAQALLDQLKHLASAFSVDVALRRNIPESESEEVQKHFNCPATLKLLPTSLHSRHLLTLVDLPLEQKVSLHLQKSV